MFVINPYLRFGLIALGFALGIGLWVAFGFWYGFLFLITALVLLIGYIFLGPVGPAAKALQTQDFTKAEKFLNLTINPNWLYSANRAFYYMTRGNIAISRKDMVAGEAFLKKAEEIDIPTPNERAALYLQLAQLEANRQRWTPAKQYLKKAKETRVTLPQLKEQIAVVDGALKNAGQVRAAQRMGKQGHGMMQRGSKRRRPKNR